MQSGYDSTEGLAYPSLLSEFTREAWNAAAPHFEGLETVDVGSGSLSDDYPFPLDSSATDDFSGFAALGDPAVRYPEGEECPPLEDFVIHGGISFRIEIPEDAVFAPRMSFIGREVDALCLVVTGMIGSKPYFNLTSGTYYPVDYAVLFLLSDGRSTFGALEWHSMDNTAMYTYDGDPYSYIVDRTVMTYKVSYLQSIVGRDPYFEKIDLAVYFKFKPPGSSKTIEDASFVACCPGSDDIYQEKGAPIVDTFSEAVFEERVDVQELRGAYATIA